MLNSVITPHAATDYCLYGIELIAALFMNYMTSLRFEMFEGPGSQVSTMLMSFHYKAKQPDLLQLYFYVNMFLIGLRKYLIK